MSIAAFHLRIKDTVLNLPCEVGLSEHQQGCHCRFKPGKHVSGGLLLLDVLLNGAKVDLCRKERLVRWLHPRLRFMVRQGSCEVALQDVL